MSTKPLFEWFNPKRIILLSLLIGLSLGLIALGSWWLDCPLPPQGLFPPSANEATHTVYIVRHDWHTGLAWQQSNKLQIGPEAWRDAPYVEVGWGDRNFFYVRDESLGSIFRAFFLSTPSVLHVVGFKETPPVYFPEVEVRQLQLSKASFERLIDYVMQTFSTDTRGQRLPPLPGKGQYGVSNFYAAVPDYGWWRTCNAWLAEGLRKAGLTVCPHRILLPQHLIDQIHSVASRSSS